MRTLYGGDVDPSRVIAFCCYHKKNMTKEQMKRKKCLEKKCGALKRLDNPYWERREEYKKLKKQWQKARKERLEKRTR